MTLPPFNGMASETPQERERRFDMGKREIEARIRLGEPSIHERLMRGEIVQIGWKMYRMCGVCYAVVRIDKPIVGDWHFCLTDDEIQAKGR